MAVKGKFTRPEIDNDEIFKLISEGVSQRCIADMMHCSLSLIQSRVRIFGWQTRTIPKPKRVNKNGAKKMCARCGKKAVPTRPVRGIQLTRLCSECFRFASNLSDIDSRSWSDVKAAISMR